MKNNSDSITQSTKTNESNYMIQLDALRALAVLGVLVHHFLPQEFFLNSTIIVAVLSWQFFEKPINYFKRNFGYKKEELSSS
jgi:peptidoglycan/LPS O-acetylase OafA/YrhL